MTCAKLSEAEDLCDAGIEDILLANQVTDPVKIRRLADLAGNCRLTVCVDNAENVKALGIAAANCGNTVHCLVEYDIGMGRCGVDTKEEVLALVKEIANYESLTFDGIQAYAGHLSHMEDPVQRKESTAENYARLKELIAYLKENGVEVATVSGGSTGTSTIKAAEGLYTELQAGSYLFMDATYRNLGLPFENSLFLLTTVVSRRGNRVMLDAGVKTCGVDQGMPALVAEEAAQIAANEEHLLLYGYTGREAEGEKLRLIPGHCCSTVNLHDKIYLVDGERVVGRLPVTGRHMGR
jgi:3-hydroxy-D-aspartate aldolase